MELNKRAATLLALIAIAMSLASYMDANWKKVEAENNAFAKDCNGRGGKAEFDNNVRQCIGAKNPVETKVSK